MRAKFLVINGPNLNLLERRDSSHYGTRSLAEIQQELEKRASELGVDLDFFQSNYEGAIIDYIQEHSPQAGGKVGQAVHPGCFCSRNISRCAWAARGAT